MTPTFRSDQTVELLQYWGTDHFAALAARVSTGEQELKPERLTGLINYLVSEGHWAPFEHLGATFRLEVPLFVLGQLTRHRHLSFSVQSGRYTEADPVFWVPDEDRPLVNKGTSARPDMGHPDAYGLGNADYWKNFLSFRSVTQIRYVATSATEQYQALLADGVAKEVARSVLPEGLYTSLYVSGNLRAWFYVLSQRNGSHGHPQHEIMEVARKIEHHISELFPLTYAAWLKTLS